MKVVMNGFDITVMGDPIQKNGNTFTFSLHSYTNKPFTDRDKEDMRKGYYKLSTFDMLVFHKSNEIFWSRFEKEINYKELQRVREAMGYSMKSLHPEELIMNELFMPTMLARIGIKISYSSSEMPPLSSQSEKNLQYIMVFYNYLFRLNQTEVRITSTSRTPRRQAELVYEDIAHKRKLQAQRKIEENAKKYMYGSSGQFAVRMLDEFGTGEKENIIVALTSGITSGRYTGFNHIENPGITADIGIFSNPWSCNDEFRNFLGRVRGVGKFLDMKTLIQGEGGELYAHHLVLIH